MVNKQPLIYNRIRKIEGSFTWISHHFFRRGFWESLTHHELLIYFFLIMVGDRQGISYYSFDKICSLTGLILDEYILARNALIDKDLIAFDGRLFQVLSLPQKVKQSDNSPVVKNKIEQQLNKLVSSIGQDISGRLK